MLFGGIIFRCMIFFRLLKKAMTFALLKLVDLAKLVASGFLRDKYIRPSFHKPSETLLFRPFDQYQYTDFSAYW